MSEQYPTPSEQGPVEYLGAPETAQPAGKGRGRSGLVAGGAAAVVALGAAGAWGVATFMSGGQEAAEVVPADALAYVSLNLDPNGGQKLEAYRTLKKFPALGRYLDASSGGDDLRRSLVKPLIDEAHCAGVDFNDDVAPWLGNALAVAAVPGGDTPQPAAFLQVSDEDAAKKGIAKLSACGDQNQIDDSNGAASTGDMVGTAFGNGWLVLATSDAKAQAVLDDASSGTLADDADYQKWVAEAGGAGIVTAYVAPDAPAAMFKAIDTNFPGQEATLGRTLSSEGSATADPSSQLDSVKGFLGDFKGGAAVVRFEDQSLEVETAFGGLPKVTSPGGDSGIGDLPDTTAVAYGVAVSDTFVQDLIDGYSEVVGKDQVDQLLKEGEQASGLVPEDLQALLGDGVTVALDGSADFSDMSSAVGAPFGVRIKGDPAQITPALDKVVGALTKAGVPAGLVSIESGDNAVGLALTPERATTLAGSGGLGAQAGFRQALPDVDKSGSGLYVGFDDGGWFDSLVSQAHDDKLAANVEPLHSLGITSWTEGTTSHGLAKLTTD